MDSHSKNVCLIGVLHIIGCLLFSLEPLTSAIDTISSMENDEETLGSETIFPLIVVAIYALLGILAILMIYGVVKQRHLLVAPFLIASSLVLVSQIISFFMGEYGGPFYNFQDSLYTMGVQIMILYPLYTLFVKLRSKSLNGKSLVEPYCDQDKKPVEVLTQKLCV